MHVSKLESVRRDRVCCVERVECFVCREVCFLYGFSPPVHLPVRRGCVGSGWNGVSKGLWRGVGEPPLRGLYNGPASSSIGHHQFREEASTRSARIFGPAVEHKRLTKRSSFFPLAQLAIALAAFSNNSRSAPRSGNAATLPTLQMESRHAASATPPAVRHRKHDQGTAHHERPCM